MKKKQLREITQRNKYIIMDLQFIKRISAQIYIHIKGVKNFGETIIERNPDCLP